MQLEYVDGTGTSTSRLIWPVALGYFQEMRILVAWCELRNGFRHFRTDRMRALVRLDACYPGKRLELLRQWRQSQSEETRTSQALV